MRKNIIKNPTIIMVLVVLISQLVIPSAIVAAAGSVEDAFITSSGLEKDISIPEIVSIIIKLVLGFLGVIFVVLIIYSGFNWMTSAGNEEKISTAKKTMVAAIIGLTIILAAYAITYFVLDVVIEATQGGHGLD